MPEITPEELHTLWEQRVRALTGAQNYFVRSKKWKAVFERSSSRMCRFGINPQRYVDAQLQWAISTNKPGIIWPNILEGDRAMARYNELPTESQSLNDLREYYLAQSAAFNLVCETLSEDVALDNNVLEHSPLFLCYVTWKSNRTPNNELVEQARAELEARPQAREIFEVLYIGFLEGR